MYVNQGEKKKKVKETSAKYEGIVRWIREQIEAEELQPGERIESEYQLCDRFGVSRQTVRHAIAVLEKEGMIEKRRGSGTYIKESGIIGVRRKKTMKPCRKGTLYCPKGLVGRGYPRGTLFPLDLLWGSGTH